MEHLVVVESRLKVPALFEKSINIVFILLHILFALGEGRVILVDSVVKVGQIEFILLCSQRHRCEAQQRKNEVNFSVH